MQLVRRFVFPLFCLAVAVAAAATSNRPASIAFGAAALVAAVLTWISVRYPGYGMMLYSWVFLSVLVAASLIGVYIGVTKDDGAAIALSILGGAASLALLALKVAMQRKIGRIGTPSSGA